MTRRAFTLWGAGNGLFAGGCTTLLRGYLRITGHRENAPERRKFGIAEPVLAPSDPAEK